ncbi:50S ribosomal protein L5 [archaeon]|nr:50S ribosomal protein L5 [archaeon]
MAEENIPKKASESNPMRKIRVSKITLNCGAGKNEALLEKAVKLLKKLSPVNPMKTKTTKRIPGWGLRPNLAIGCKATVREGARELLLRLLEAKAMTLKAKQFDAQGNFSFGIAEYIDIPGLEYDPDLKIMGLEVAVSLERPGYSIKRRKIRSRKVGSTHVVSKEDAIKFAREELGITVEA